MIEGYGFL